MKKIIALLITLCTLQIQTSPEKAIESAEKYNRVCATLILQMEAQEKQIELTEETFQAGYKAILEHCEQKIRSWTQKQQQEFINLIHKCKTTDDLLKIFTALYGKDLAEILYQALQQIAQQKIGEISHFYRALQSIRTQKSFSEYTLEEIQHKISTIQKASPEELQKVEKLLRHSEEEQKAILKKFILDVFSQN